MSDIVDSIMIQKNQENLVKQIKKLIKENTNAKANDKKELENQFLELVSEAIKSYRYRLEIFFEEELSDNVVKVENGELKKILFRKYEKQIERQFNLILVPSKNNFNDTPKFKRKSIFKSELDGEEDEIQLDIVDIRDCEEIEIPQFKYDRRLAVISLKTIHEIVEEYLDLDILMMINYLKVREDEYNFYGFNSKSLYENNKNTTNRIFDLGYDEFHQLLEKNNEEVDIVLTDPPYFIKQNAIWDNEKSAKDRQKYFEYYLKTVVPILSDDAILLIFNDFSNIDIIENAIEQIKQDLEEGDYLDWEEEFKYNYLLGQESMEAFNFTVLGYLEWVKSNPASRKSKSTKETFGNYTDSEYIILAVKNYETNPRVEQLTRILNETREFYSSVNQDTIIREKDVRIHSTTKKPEILQEIITKFTNPGDIILDSFSGSGAISIACYENGRDSLACEVDSYMYKMSIGRFETVKQLIGYRPFPIDISKMNGTSLDDRFKNSYLYEKYKNLIEEVYWAAIEPLSKNERIDYVRKSLTEMAKPFGRNNINISELNESEVAFSIGFVQHYMNPVLFKKYYSVSRANPRELFERFKNVKKITELKIECDKEVEKYKDEKRKRKTIEKKYSAEIAIHEGNGKFIIDQVVRLYFRIFSPFNYNVNEIISYYKNSKALSDYKNKTIEEKQEACKSYSKYLQKTIQIFLVNENSIQKKWARREKVQKKEIEKCKKFYEILTKMIVFYIYMNEKSSSNSAISEEFKFFVKRYLNLLDDKKLQKKILRKLGIDNVDENREIDLHPLVRNSILKGLSEVGSMFSNLKNIHEFSISYFEKEIQQLLKENSELLILFNVRKIIKKKSNLKGTKIQSLLTPTNIRKGLRNQLDGKWKSMR